MPPTKKDRISRVYTAIMRVIHSSYLYGSRSWPKYGFNPGNMNPANRMDFITVGISINDNDAGFIKIIDQAVAQRLYTFRKKYVDKNQETAAEKLGVSNAWLSRAERGLRPLNINLVKTFKKLFNLNQSWLTSGTDPETKVPAAPTAATSLQAAHQEIALIERTMKILQANFNAAFKMIEQQNKIIEQLNERIEKLEAGK